MKVAIETNKEHPVWSILNKEKYCEASYSVFESMYDFISALVRKAGNTTVDGNTVPTMKVFHDMWNNYSGEVFYILGELVKK